MNLLLNNSTLIIVLFATILGVLGLFVLVAGIFTFGGKDVSVSRRVKDFVLEPEQKKIEDEVKGKRILGRELSGSFVSRTLAPAMKKLIDFFGKYTPVKSVDKLNKRLSIAGNPMNMRAQEFYGLRVLILFIGIGLAVLVNYNHIPFETNYLLIGVAFILFALLLPLMWLNSKVKNVQDEIRHNLPDALDMLSVCASAGLGFDQSLQKITEYWPTALGREFKRVTQEMEMGMSRSQALRNMADRLDVDELTSFISIIVQAEEMGMSFADVLHSQADQMRIMRQYRAKEIANRMPAKMIIPLAIFIFPALIAVILGPVVPTLMNAFK
ncbi:MAG: type II secretion system F family protein [Anaerolineaceae bacterium]